MAGEIKIKVVSVAGGKLENEAGATVCVVPAADVESLAWPYASVKATHVHGQNGNYECPDPAIGPGVGKWMLIVSKDGMSPVVQMLTITSDAGILIASPGWDNRGKAVSRTAATVSIVPYNRKQGATAAQYSLITVRLFKRKEVVMLASHNHIDGTNYMEFAYGRRNRLYREGAIDAGSIVTIFGADQRTHYTMVKDSSPDNKGWLMVSSKDIDPVGIIDFYQHLDIRGTGHPGTVREAGIFGHAYFNGPIIWNTTDGSNSFTDRDPADFDGRAKDWVQGGLTLDLFPNMNKAFTSDAEFRVWGCNHMLNVISECRSANQQDRAATPRDRFFDMRLDAYSAFERGTLDHLKCNIAQYVKGKKIRHSLEWGDATGVVAYAGHAAQYLTVPCFASPPGAGSLYRNTLADGWEGYVSRTGESEAVFRFLEREFGADFKTDSQNYMNYTAMLAATLPSPGWSTERFMRYRDDDIDQSVLRLPSGLEVYRASGAFQSPVPLSIDDAAGHLYAAPESRPDHIEQRGPYRVLILERAPGENCGVLVLANGRSLLMRRLRPNDQWFRNNDPVEARQMKLDNFGRWRWAEDTDVPRENISNGEIEAVTPAWYW